MGSSPSKGKPSAKADGTAPDKRQPEVSPHHCEDPGPVEEVNASPQLEECVPVTSSTDYTPEQAQDQGQLVVDIETNAEEKEVDVIAPEKVTEVFQADEVKRAKRRAKNKKKRCLEKLRKPSITKVDFPPHMVRAHQAAYAFLNPNISKFETLLGLMDQATNTQLSLQPMMTALVLRFEEINQALEEMAEEGELMLKEHGVYMASPQGMMGPAIMSGLQSGHDRSSPPDPPPDLLQQLLQHSTEKMRQVGGSFQTVGDTALEEAAEYFAALSKLLVEKMKAKHGAEVRIAQVLAQVEAAAMRKCKLEDSALHSEDSGIGGENDSLGSDRQRRHRDSAGSGSSASGANVRAALPNNSPNEQNWEEEEEEEEEDDDIDEEDEDTPVRKRSNSSPPDPSQTFFYMHEMFTKEHRPHTAESEALLLLHNSNEQMKNNSEVKNLAELQINETRRHSLGGSGRNKRLAKMNQVCALPMLASQPAKPPSVKRLINSFSGTEQSWENLPTHTRRPRKSTLPLSNGSNCPEGALVNVSWPDNRDPDEDNLPPPPPEVLLDNSFQGTESLSSEKSYQNAEGLNKKRGLSQRLKTVELLPNRGSIKPRSVISSAHPVRQDAIEDRRVQETVLDPDSSLYQQARTIIHMRSAVGPLQQAPQRRDSTDICEGDMSCSLPIIAPPVSRVRLPPSCPSVRHRFPSPPAVRPQSRSSRPSSPSTVTRATENQVEEIVPSVSFHDARSVFCQNEAASCQAWASSGASVLPRPWGEGSRGRPGSRGVDSTRRTQSEHRPAITIRTGASKRDNTPGH